MTETNNLLPRHRSRYVINNQNEIEERLTKDMFYVIDKHLCTSQRPCKGLYR